MKVLWWMSNSYMMFFKDLQSIGLSAVYNKHVNTGYKKRQHEAVDKQKKSTSLFYLIVDGTKTVRCG